MFTGLIEEKGNIKDIEASGKGLVLTISAEEVLQDTKVGDSISIDGVCLTVTALWADRFSAFCSRVTASSTTLNTCQPGREVNLERAMLPSSRFGGHFVQGHVDGTGIIKKIEKDENGGAVEISMHDDPLMKYVVEKGSITVDGISLTVVSLNKLSFTVYIIPETLERTTLGKKKSGDLVNIEVDVLAKYIERLLESRNSENTENDDKRLRKKLMEEGYY